VRLAGRDFEEVPLVPFGGVLFYVLLFFVKLVHLAALAHEDRPWLLRASQHGAQVLDDLYDRCMRGRSNEYEMRALLEMREHAVNVLAAYEVRLRRLSDG